MARQHTKRPAPALADNGSREADRLAGSISPRDNPRSARRQRLTQHLYDAGPRPVLEALIAVESGQPLDWVLEDFSRVPVEIYHAICADDLPFSRLGVIDGGKTC